MLGIILIFAALIKFLSMNWEQLLSSQRVGARQKSNPSDARSAFEQDYDRIIFSHPFRRLQDKTQVHPLPVHDFVHTRLTHSLEVSSVGRSLGRKVGEVILQRHPHLAERYSAYDFGAIVAAAALAHDLGNPPFGHSGEQAISDFFRFHPSGLFFKDKVDEKQWEDLTNFEGNAQGFRILNKKQFQGLKLTYATLAAFSKYPRESLIDSIDADRSSQKKYGFFQSEKEVFHTLATEIGLKKQKADEPYLWHRHPLAFLVEAADDICYHIIDLEDGCRLGLVGFDKTVELLAGILGTRFDRQKLNAINGQSEQVGALRAMSIGILTDQVTQVFLDNEASILEGNFDRPLTELIASSAILTEIIQLSIEKIYRSHTVVATEAAGFEVLPGLLESFTTAAYEQFIGKGKSMGKHKGLLRLMPEARVKEMSWEAPDVYKVVMNCTDYIASMTDSHAISLFRKIKGISLPGNEY